MRDRKSGLPLKSGRKIVSVVADDIDISKLFQIVLSEDMEGITVVSFNDPIRALEHFYENKSEYVCYF
jgi:hypothetical protein